MIVGLTTFLGYLGYQWRLTGKRFVILLQKLFEISAMKISKRPFCVISVTLCVAFIFVSGFTRFNVEENVKYLFLPEGNQASQDLKRAARYGYNLELRQEEVIILPRKNENILSTKCMQEVLELHQLVVGIDGYDKLCYKPFSQIDKCTTLNVLEAFGYKRINLDDPISRLKTLMANESFILANARTLKDNFFGLFGGNIRNRSLHDVTSLRMVYYMAEHDTDTSQREQILAWEMTFLKNLSTFAKNKACVGEVAYSAERSLDDSVAETTGSDIKFFAVTFTIMGIFSAVVNGKFCDGTHGHQLLSFASMAAIYLGVVGSFGLLSFAGVPFVNMAGILPFLIVSIGVDDVFIILHELNEIMRGTLPASHVISSTMAKAGPTITMTTLTDLVAFAVSCQSIFPAVRYFCAYAAASISFAFLLIVTFFVACMWLDVKRIRRKRNGCLPCFSSTPPPPCCISRYGLDKVMVVWGKIIMTTTGKLVVCSVSLLLLGGGIYGVLNIDDSFKRQLLTKDDSHYRRYLDVYEENFHLEIDVNVIIPGNLNYSDEAVQKQFLNLETIARDNPYYKNKVTSWLPEYLKWEKDYRSMFAHQEFYWKFNYFVNLPKNRRFFHDVIFSADKKSIIASRARFFSKSNPASQFQKEMMTTIRKDLAEQSNLGAFVVQQNFVYFEQYTHVVGETIRNLVIAGTSILVISSLFLCHPAIILCLLFGFVEIILALFGLMYLWNVSINSISMINLVMALGFSVDYNAHVAYHFVTAKSNSVDQRVIDALKGVGGSVFLGGVSTFLGMLPTSFASSLVFQIFFKMFFGIVLIGLFHGLVVLPVYLSVLGKFFNFQQVNSMSALRKWMTKSKVNIEHHGKLKGFEPNKAKLPVAIVGMSCRFAGGVNSIEDFWNMLVEGKCGINRYPKNRPTTKLFEDTYNPGRKTPGKHYVLKGAFLDDIVSFDAQFFGVSATESKSMDPQQRLLLHVVYEAIEDAGLQLEDLQQTQTGIYVGLMNLDYSGLVLDQDNIRRVDQFASTGTTYSVMANRISFLLNLTGPSLTVDTACSSSLTALHLAIGHLRSGEVDVAIVCAPNILLNGRGFHLACCRAGMLAEDGCCKSFDIKGDGYGRGEGVAAVVLTLSSRVTGNTDDSYAEILASGVNNDGQNSIPMTSPSAFGQSTLFKKVLQESGLSKEDISYVEAHGTGTAVGDVVEMASISAIYGNSDRRTLRIGSVKSNINHTESVAGLAGLIKTCLMIKHGQLVPTINVHREKPDLRIPETQMMVQVHHEQWQPLDGKPRIAAVCSYGYGGSNAHVIVREVPQGTALPRQTMPPRKNRVMTLTAHSSEALEDMARKTSQYLRILATKENELLKDNFCYSLNEKYTTHPHRLAITFSSFKEAVDALDGFCIRDGRSSTMASVYHTSSTPRENIVFLYGGQGARWHGMATEMMKHEPVFKKAIKKIDIVLKKLGVSWLLVNELEKSEDESRIKENPIGQMALFGVHYALTQLLKSWDVVPSAALGHSLGEISAACAAGCLTLEQAMKIILLRSALQESCSVNGSMAAVSMSVSEAEEMLDRLDLAHVIDIAVVNSPKDLVLSGDRESIRSLGNHLAESHGNIFWKELPTTRAFHSKEMEKIKDKFFTCIKRINVKSSHEIIPFFSSVRGAQILGSEMDQKHWWHNIREKVQFSSALEELFNEGNRTFLEINVGKQLARHVLTTWSEYRENGIDNGNNVVVIQTLPKRDLEDQHKAFLQNCVANMFTNGIPLKWSKIQGCGSKSFIRRPTYPWQKADYWYCDRETGEVGLLDENVAEKESSKEVKRHPLLGSNLVVKQFCGLFAWENETELHKLPYMRDHKFTTLPDPVVPAAVYVEMVFAAVKQITPLCCPDIREMSFNNLMTISEEDSFRLRTRFVNSRKAEPWGEFQITKVEDEDEAEILVSKCCICFDCFGKQEDTDVMDEQIAADNLESFKDKMVAQPSDIIKTKRYEAEMDFGSEFDLIKSVWASKNEVFTEIVPTEEILRNTISYVIHPCIIDASFQSCLFIESFVGQLVPHQMNKMILQRAHITSPMYCHVEQYEKTCCNITLYDCLGRIVIRIERLSFIASASLSAPITYRNAAFTEEWSPVQLSSGYHAGEETTWIILQDEYGISNLFKTYLPNESNICTVEQLTANENIPNVIQGYLATESEKSRHAGNHSRLIVVNFSGVDASKLDGNIENFRKSHQLSFERSLLTLRTMIKHQQLFQHMRLVLVTMEAVCINTTAERNDGLGFPWPATLVGFRRTLAREMPQIASILVDLPGLPSTLDFQRMVTDLSSAIVVDEEIAYRDGLRYVNILTKLRDEKEISVSEERSVNELTGDPKPIELAFRENETFLREKLDTITSNNETPVIVLDYASPIPSCGQQPAMNPQQRFAFSGRLPNNYSVEKKVVGVCNARNLATWVFSSECCVSDALNTLPVPQAASLCWPMAFSYYIVSDVLKENTMGKTILVYHENIQIVFVFALVAVSSGARPICVVNNKDSACCLRRLGNYKVFTADEVLSEELENVSLDVVCLLSRPPQNVFPSLATALKSHGTLFVTPDDKKAFIEISGYEKDTKVIIKNVGDAITKNSETFSALLAGCIALLTSSGNRDTLLGLPQETTSIYEYFTCQDDKRNRCGDKCPENVTLNIISFRRDSIPKSAQFYRLPFDNQGVRKKCSYLVVGGIRGFGFEVVKWLVDNGADVVMCTALSAPSAEKMNAVHLLEEEKNSRILMRQADVTSWKDMCGVVEELQNIATISGIVFSAMFLKDQAIIDADFETCEKVVATKVLGAVVLHQLSLNMKLDFFILFSSVAGVLGNIGQLSYASANSFLDCLCRYRRNKLGLPALSVNWGPITGTGALERSKNLVTSLKSQGLGALSFGTALQFLKLFLWESPDSPQVGLCNTDWPLLLRSFPCKSTRYGRLYSEFESLLQLQEKMSLKSLALLPVKARESYVEKSVRVLLSSWSATSQDEVDLKTGLYRFGVDSVGAASMAMVLYDTLEAKFESFFFIQPKTNGAAIINEVLRQVEAVKVEISREGDTAEYGRENMGFDGELGAEVCENTGNGSTPLSLKQDIRNRPEVVPLHAPDQTKAKVFLVHPSRKDVFAYAAFAPSFEKQTLLALYSIGCTDSIREIDNYGSVHTIANEYVKLIQQKQRKGPYYLGGYSFGGTLVYQMASILTEKGEKVEMVFMLDTSNWSPVCDTDSREILLAKAKEFCAEAVNISVSNAIKKTACRQLGMSFKDFQILKEMHEDQGALLDELKELADRQNITIDIRKEISVIKHEMEGASSAHNNWQPSLVRYKGLLTYVQCEESRRVKWFWDAPNKWKSLTNQMDWLHIPGDHFVTRSEVRARLSGSLLMTTAAMKYLSMIDLQELSRFRSQVEERLVDRLKKGVTISKFVRRVVLRAVKGCLQLNSDESAFTFKAFSGTQRKIKLKDLHNILPALYVNDAIKELKMHEDADLVICMITTNNKLSLFKCSDLCHLNDIMDCLDALFKVPLVRRNDYT